MRETNSPLATAFILFFFTTTLFSPGSSLRFNYTSFPDNTTNDFIRANAYIAAGTIQITPDFLPNMSGRICYNKPFRISRDGGRIRATFTTTFVLQVNPKTQPPGEGLAFILTGDPALPGNSSGQWLGITNPVTNGSSRIVAVEFDTRKSYREDLDDNHVGLDIDGVDSVRQESLSGFGLNLSSSDVVTARVQYDGSNLTVFVSERLVFREPIDLSAHLPEVVHVGFSGSTSWFAQQNCILSWEFVGWDIGNGRFRSAWVWVVLSVGISGLTVGIVGFIYYQRRRKSSREKKFYDEGHRSVEEAIRWSSTAPRKFKVKELIEASKNFNLENKLGNGGFGTVYKGVLENREIAVKRVSKVTSHGKQEFIAEVTTIGNLHHRNLVKLIGWAHERQEYLLVYEYMPNGSLDKFIFSDVAQESISIIGWETRLKIIRGVARALEYLHNGCERKVLHRDIKASNIMLDSEFNAKLGDFGLARTIARQAGQTHHSTQNLAGTPGYMAPEIFLTGRATLETDVYAFGVLVLEVACGRRPGGQLDQDGYASNIVKWVWELHARGSLIDAADCRMDKDFVEEEEMGCVLALGLACCHPDPFKRPIMKTAVQVLTGEVAGPEVPLERPAFMWPPGGPFSAGADELSLVGTQLTEITGR